MDEPIKAIARRVRPATFTHRVHARGHELIVDEPKDKGGDDEGLTPQALLAASLASCTAVTMEMYAQRKEWDIGLIEVECEYDPPDRGSPTEFTLVLRLPSGLTDEQVEKLRVIAGKCPVHRSLEGGVAFAERVELIDPAAARPG
jgi:putative redox protein